MKRLFKTLVLACVIVGAFTAMAAASASAASFEASAKGELKGHVTSTEGNQVFTTNGGTVTCTKATTKGTVTELVANHQVVHVQYEGCTAFGFAEVKITEAEYDLFAGGTVNILKPITITVNPIILPKCTVSVPEQKSSVAESEEGKGLLGTVSYESPGTKIIEKSAVKGITYTTSGGACGSGGSNGTYTGNNEVELVGGTLHFNP